MPDMDERDRLAAEAAQGDKDATRGLVGDLASDPDTEIS